MTSAETEDLLRWFAHAHLPPDLAEVSRACSDLAHLMASKLTSSRELTAGLRKLLEAKDCFVRAAIDSRVLEESEENSRGVR